MNSRYLFRLCLNRGCLLLARLSVLISLIWLGLILFFLLHHGLKGLSFHTFIFSTQPPGIQGGLLNAIIGSLMIAGTAILLAAPFGILAGTYLAEYSHANRFAKFIRLFNDTLLSAPSIIIGLFIYQIYVIRTQHFSGWAGCFALMILAIPIIVRTTEDMYSLIPSSLREAAFALGTPKWKVITMIVLRVSRTGVITGVLLALARISGETAPLLFTTLNNQFFSFNMNQPMANLPMVIYQYALSPYHDWHQLAWTGALLISIWVLGMNIILRLIFKQKPPLH